MDRTPQYQENSLSLVGATALGILAFKGFTTITNSGSEIKDPHKNVGRAIMMVVILLAERLFLFRKGSRSLSDNTHSH